MLCQRSNSRKLRNVVPRRQDYSIGHSITYTISVRNLQVLNSWPFKKKYTTDCDISPTTWELEVVFLDVKEDGTSSLSVSLKRVDTEDCDLEAGVWVQICNRHEFLIFPKQTFENEMMMPDDAINETVEISAFPEAKEELGGNVVVFISIMTCYCHAETDSDYSSD